MPGESKYTVGFTATFFLASAVLALVAVATPEWVIQELHADYHFGVIQMCAEFAYDGVDGLNCHTPDNFPPEWHATAAFLIVGIIALFAAVVFTVWSYVEGPQLKKARWLAAFAAVMFSIASLIFPSGFDGEPLGGKPYKLPENSAIGFSYILFVVALLLIFAGELFALKVLLPGG